MTSRSAPVSATDLMAENEKLRAADRIEQIAFDKLNVELTRLRSVNADMLAAINKYLAHQVSHQESYRMFREVAAKARPEQPTADGGTNG